MTFGACAPMSIIAALMPKDFSNLFLESTSQPSCIC